ncbi:3581_t:CDS:1, partial [Dentiscutata heterogama]
PRENKHIKSNDTSNNDEMVITNTKRIMVTPNPLITLHKTDDNDDYRKKVKRLKYVPHNSKEEHRRKET